MIYPSTSSGTSAEGLAGGATLSAERFLNFTVAAYVLAIYLVSAVPGLSRAVHLSVGLMLLAILLQGSRRGLILPRSPVLPVALIFMTYAFSSVLWSINQGAALVSAIGLIVDVVGASLVLIAFHNGVKPLTVAVCAAIGASIQALVALQQNLGAGELRAEGLTGNANSLAIQLSVSAFLLLLIVPRSRWSQLLALALIIVATVTSGSRKMLFVWFSYGILMVRNFGLQLRRRSVLTAGLLIGLPLLAWLFVTYSPILLGPLEELTFIQRVEGTLEGRATDKRSGLIEDALEQWWQQPILGYGIDQYRQVSRYSAYSHNNYTELLASLGVVGLLLFYVIYALLIVKAMRRALQGHRASWTVLAILLVLLLMDIARVSYTSRSTWLLIGVMAYFVEPTSDEPETELTPERGRATSLSG